MASSCTTVLPALDVAVEIPAAPPRRVRSPRMQYNADVILCFCVMSQNLPHEMNL